MVHLLLRQRLSNGPRVESSNSLPSMTTESAAVVQQQSVEKLIWTSLSANNAARSV